MNNPLYDGLFGRHRSRSAPFLSLPDGSAVTYAAFLDRAEQFAKTLQKIGLVPGDRMAAQVEKSADALALYAACVQAGIVFLPLNTSYTAAELSYFVDDSGANLVMCDRRAFDMMTGIAEPLGTRVETLNGDGSGSFAEILSTGSARFRTVELGKDDLAAILYTSGTTGRSKGAMLTQNNLLSNAETLAELWQFDASDVLLHALPIFHTHGLFVATNVTLIGGGSMIFLPGFNIDEIFRQLPKSTVMMGVPTFYGRLLKDARLSADLTARMRLFISGSAPLSPKAHAQFESRTGHRILERYGMTETNMNTSNPIDGERRAGTVGFPLPGVEMKITDPSTGCDLADGQIGRIEVRGPNLFKGYWRMPEKTASELRGNGFFVTGDLGKIDEDGYLHIVGREKDLIISGGYNIYPKEIELILDAQPGVNESAVIGVPHADFGETVLGLIVAEPGCKLDLDAIAATAAVSLARFKLPKKLIVIDSFPRNALGKIQKAKLAELYGDLFVAA